MTDLQELSREAARKLPKKWHDPTGLITTPDGLIVDADELASNTSACTEIAVHFGIDIYFSIVRQSVCTVAPRTRAQEVTFKDAGSKIQAFRTAVIRAVVAL